MKSGHLLIEIRSGFTLRNASAACGTLVYILSYLGVSPSDLTVGTPPSGATCCATS